MLKKLLIVLAILAPSMLYLYIVSDDQNKAKQNETQQTATPSEAQHTQTPDH